MSAQCPHYILLRFSALVIGGRCHVTKHTRGSTALTVHNQNINNAKESETNTEWPYLWKKVTTLLKGEDLVSPEIKI